MMNKRFENKIVLSLLFAVCLLIPSGAYSASSSGDAHTTQFREKVETVFSDFCLKGAKIGVKFYSLEKRETLYEWNADQLFAPASNMKMVTSAVALNRFGPDYRFHTHLYTTGSVENNILKGDLYIKGFGDPNLITEQMWLLVNELKNLPVKKVEGNIIADGSYFDDQLYVVTWKRRKGAEAYNAPLGALSFNFNTITVHVQPGAKKGDRPVVVVDPETDYIKVQNSAVTSNNRGKKRRLKVNRIKSNGHDIVTVKGTLPKNVKRKKYYLNITDPLWHTAIVFKKFLAQAGVEVTGEIHRGKVPDDAKLLVDHKSEPLHEILRGLNKYSNNFIAEQILKTLAAEHTGSPGTTENGVSLLREYLQSLGHSPDGFKIVDGSGLSRQNRLAPNQIVDVLENVYDDMSIFPEFISALGVMGVDGSVEDRMNGNKNAQKARVKTGTLNNISALSGYFQSRDGERFAFSILMNELKCSNGKILDLQDRILTEGLNFERGD